MLTIKRDGAVRRKPAKPRGKAGKPRRLKAIPTLSPAKLAAAKLTKAGRVRTEWTEQKEFFDYIRAKKLEAAIEQGCTTLEMEARHRASSTSRMWLGSPLVELAESDYHMIYHVPNRGLKKLIGEQPGVFDVICDIPWRSQGDAGQVTPGLRMECKRSVGGKISAEQRIWEARWKARGYICRYFFHTQQGIDILEAYRSGRLVEQGGDV